MRWIAANQRGKKGEILYPGSKDMEASFQIDILLETSESTLPKFVIHSRPDCTEEKVRELITTAWRDYLKLIDKQLSKNVNQNFLVGNGITMADISLSQFILKYPLNEYQPANYRKLY